MTLSMKLHYFGRGRISDSPLTLITAPSQYIAVTANHAGTEMGEENRREGGGKEVVGTMRAIHVMNDSDRKKPACRQQKEEDDDGNGKGFVATGSTAQDKSK
jgi:hypothetical protein